MTWADPSIPQADPSVISRFLEELRADPELAPLVGYAQAALAMVGGSVDHATEALDRITAAWKRART